MEHTFNGNATGSASGTIVLEHSPALLTIRRVLNTLLSDVMLPSSSFVALPSTLTVLTVAVPLASTCRSWNFLQPRQSLLGVMHVTSYLAQSC